MNNIRILNNRRPNDNFLRFTYFNISSIQIKKLKVNTVDNKYISKRLVKIITHSNSYDKYNFYNKVKNGTF